MVQTTQHVQMLTKVMNFFLRLHDKKIALENKHVIMLDDFLKDFESGIVNPAPPIDTTSETKENTSETKDETVTDSEAKKNASETKDETKNETVTDIQSHPKRHR